MFDFFSQNNLLIQGCIAAIIIGVFYNLWITTRAYGGLIGRAVRFLGIGMLFITVAMIEHALVNLDVVVITPNLGLLQDLLNLIGLVLLGIGFSKLGAATKV